MTAIDWYVCRKCGLVFADRGDHYVPECPGCGVERSYNDGRRDRIQVYLTTDSRDAVEAMARRDGLNIAVKCKRCGERQADLACDGFCADCIYDWAGLENIRTIFEEDQRRWVGVMTFEDD